MTVEGFWDFSLFFSLGRRRIEFKDEITMLTCLLSLSLSNLVWVVIVTKSENDRDGES